MNITIHSLPPEEMDAQSRIIADGHPGILEGARRGARPPAAGGGEKAGPVSYLSWRNGPVREETSGTHVLRFSAAKVVADLAGHRGDDVL